MEDKAIYQTPTANLGVVKESYLFQRVVGVLWLLVFAASIALMYAIITMASEGRLEYIISNIVPCLVLASFMCFIGFKEVPRWVKYVTSAISFVLLLLLVWEGVEAWLDQNVGLVILDNQKQSIAVYFTLTLLSFCSLVSVKWAKKSNQQLQRTP